MRTKGGRIQAALPSLVLAGVAGILWTGAGVIGSAEPPVPVTIGLVGDIMLSRNVAARMRDAGDALLPFRNLSALLDSTDLNFGNLESPFSPPRDRPEDGWDGIAGGTSLIFAAPDKSVQALRRYNFRVVSLANNHAMDQGEAGLVHTVRRLAEGGVQAVGAGADLEQAWAARRVEVRGRSIGFLSVSYASLNYGTDERNDFVARIEDVHRLRAKVVALKSQASFIVVAMHAGSEYTSRLTPAQIGFAHAAIDAGANVVVGSHPHWLQAFERYKGGLIFYSLGNFVFDLDSSPATRQGAAVKLTIGAGNACSVDIVPIEIENSCCPRPASPDEAAEALRRMRLRSAHIPVVRRSWTD